jgi:sec-independent protein translocase protein TatA
MFGFKFEELIVVLLIVLVLFGGKKIPELSRSLGEAIKELRKGFTDDPHEKKVQKTETKQDEEKS